MLEEVIQKAEKTALEAQSVGASIFSFSKTKEHIPTSNPAQARSDKPTKEPNANKKAIVMEKKSKKLNNKASDKNLGSLGISLSKKPTNPQNLKRKRWKSKFNLIFYTVFKTNSN